MTDTTKGGAPGESSLSVFDLIAQLQTERAKHERVLQALAIAVNAMTNCRMQFADMMSRVKAPDAWMIEEIDKALAQIEELQK